MKTELSLAAWTVSPGGSSCCSRGSTARTPAATSSGLAVAWRITPVDTEGWPFSRTLERSLAAPCSICATSRSRTL
jgi:hypothetical protein